MRYFLLIICSVFIFTCKNSSTNDSSTKNENHKYTNKLLNESSPYLLQHAHNPVNWYPWGEEALKKAKDEDKLIIISVGYSSCHWCHVMEHESFEDTLVSRIMNENFVSIKVDREERPDIDDIYMTACQLTNQRGCGWPLNAIALPDGRPFWAGTYFPKSDWMQLLNGILDSRKKEPAELEKMAGYIAEGYQVESNLVQNNNDQNFTKSKLEKIADNFYNSVDFKKGGRKGTQKFPMPCNFEFLLSYHHFSKDPKALEAVTSTLDGMALGGIYDHLDGGFARYSTDPNWKVPHFEKMLYDNSQLVSLYSQAFQFTKNPLYKKVVDETLNYVKTEMTHKNGGFYSSLDADSEGEEGKFYVWEKTEIDQVLGEELSDIFSTYYSIRTNGNWEHKKNILLRKKSEEDVAKKFKITIDELNRKIDQAKEKLYTVRNKRVKPGLDDKILTSWNAMMLKGYVDAYRAFGKGEYLNSALKNAEFILKNVLQKDFRLNRNFKDGKSVINAFLDDYALLIDAFIGLYQVTFNEKWLNHSKKLTEYVNAHFYDEKSGLYFFTSDLDPALVTRKIETSDGAIPASNSIMARNLYHLGTITYQPDWVKKSKQMLHNMVGEFEDSKQPFFYANWLSTYLTVINPPYEVAVVGENCNAISKELMKSYIPNALVLGGKTEGTLDLLKDKLQEGETMIYVCQNRVCKFPVTKASKALELMK